MVPVHPGRVLKRELRARELSANRLAIELKLPSGRITDIVNAKRGISPDTALRLARYFGNSARFWLNLQTAYELAVAEREVGDRIRDEVRPARRRRDLRAPAFPYLRSACSTFADGRPSTFNPFLPSKSAIAALVLAPMAPSGAPTS